MPFTIMTRALVTTSSLVCCWLAFILASSSGNAQIQFSNVTKTQASVISPNTVRFTCVAAAYPDIESVIWCAPNSTKLNSTSVSRTSLGLGSTVTATLEIERTKCESEYYSCLFENEITSFSAILDCPPVAEVSFMSSAYTVGEGDGPAEVCVTVVNATNGSLISFVESDINAARRRDFSLPQTFDLTVDCDQLTTVHHDTTAAIISGILCFNISITQDHVFEHDLESFRLEVKAGDILARSSSVTTIYIQDDDELVVGFEKELFTFHEGDAECTSTVRVCAVVSGSIVGLPVLIVPVWMEGTAIDGVDYHPPPCNFTFSPGGYIDCMDLTLVDDDVIEFTETLSVSIGSVFVDGAQIQSSDRARVDVGEALIEITDNDAFELSFEEAVYTIHEGGPGEDHTALKVCLVQRRAHRADLGEGKDSLTVNVTISTRDGTAIGGRDFAAVNSAMVLTLPLPIVGEAAGICECIMILHDEAVESTEFFELRLHSSHSLVKTNNSRALIRDSQSVVSVGFERSEYTASEREGYVEVCVVLNGSHQRSIRIFLCTGSGTAIEDLDYVGISAQRLFFAAGPFSPSTSGGKVCANVTILEDGLLEDDEVFTVSLQSSDPAVEFGLSTTSVVIQNENGALPSLTFVNNTPSVRGDMVHADFTISNSQLVSSVSCVLKGPGRTPPVTHDCSSGHVTYSNLPLRRQQFTLTVFAFLQTQPQEPLVLSELDLRLDHDVCWLHPINEGVVIKGNVVTVEWQATGPMSDSKVSEFLCRRDRERTETPCTSPYIWNNPSPGSHSLSVRPAPTPNCRRHIARVFNFVE